MSPKTINDLAVLMVGIYLFVPFHDMLFYKNPAMADWQVENIRLLHAVELCIGLMVYAYFLSRF